MRNNLHNGVVSGAARGQALLGPMWARERGSFITAREKEMTCPLTGVESGFSCIHCMQAPSIQFRQYESMRRSMQRIVCAGGKLGSLEGPGHLGLTSGFGHS